jgi:excisionase family DNA binding protein
MDKEKAANYLKMSVRQLQRHMAAKRVEYSTVDTPRGKEARFTREQLDRFKKEWREEKETGISPVALAPVRQLPEVPNDALQSIAEVLHGLQMIQREIVEEMKQRPALPAAPDEFSGIAPDKSVSIENKLMLTLPEASEVSGISVEHLRAAVRDGKLKTVKGIGGGYGKVKRSELDRFIKAL